ncbi:hypothetical protein F5Y18DRAFT_367166 [Xylariaceae sp. FL1019]|nr:hypothetical protein F5Y18DRAFT_367166 [Xylariaceae sp. FL1019]
MCLRLIFTRRPWLLPHKFSWLLWAVGKVVKTWSPVSSVHIWPYMSLVGSLALDNGCLGVNHTQIKYIWRKRRWFATETRSTRRQASVSSKAMRFYLSL